MAAAVIRTGGCPQAVAPSATDIEHCCLPLKFRSAEYDSHIGCFPRVLLNERLRNP
jgi:hypothetical protein